MTSQTIFTLDAREHTFLEVLNAHSKLTSAAIYNEISLLFKDLLITLEDKNINYQDLKNALIPRSDRNEIAFVFDTRVINSSSYGYEVFSALIPLLEKDSRISILCGDYVGEEKFKKFLKMIFLEHIITEKEIDYAHHSFFFIIYINNLSKTHFLSLTQELKQFNPYVGYFNLTYASPIKTYLSTILIRLFLKNKMTILVASEDNEDVNVTSYPFENSGYKFKGIDSLHYGLFLSYKIEREIFPGFESDTTFSINAITENVFEISDFNFLIEDKKLEYLLKEKTANLERAGMTNLTTSELENLIKDKVSSNYIYNLSFLPASQTLKFNIIIETTRVDINKPIKLTVALEYMTVEKTLRLITMF